MSFDAPPNRDNASSRKAFRDSTPFQKPKVAFPTNVHFGSGVRDAKINVR